jgi:hypothetical protein
MPINLRENRERIPLLGGPVLGRHEDDVRDAEIEAVMFEQNRPRDRLLQWDPMNGIRALEGPLD